MQSVFDWIGRHEAIVLIALLVVVLAVLGFVMLANEVAVGGTMPFDEWAVQALRHADDPGHPIGPAWLTSIATDVTALGGPTVLTMFTLAVAGFLWLRNMRGAMVLILVATFGGFALSLLLKSAFERPRPALVPHLTTVYSSSFPSGHSMLSAAVFLTLGALLARFVCERALRAYCLIVALVLTLLVGASRVFLGVHYPSDVLAGWAAGLAWAVLCWLVARFLQNRGVVEKSDRDLRTRERECDPSETSR